MSATIEPCRDPDALRAYIDEHWRSGHVLAACEEMFRFTYMTPWVDTSVFDAGISVLTVTDRGRLLGFLGAICAPYPRPSSYWLALWHVQPELKGTGLGGRLLKEMQEIALAAGGWIGTFGAGPEALPVYLKRGYAVRAARRWVYDPASPIDDAGPATPPVATETLPTEAWEAHRFEHHPAYEYEHAISGSMFRTERNGWGRVTHAVRLRDADSQTCADVFRRESAAARREGCPYLMDAWAFEQPGPGWTLAPDDLPSVFHPPEARGSVTYAVGYPFLPSRIHKGDCDQDRPNLAVQLAQHVDANGNAA